MQHPGGPSGHSGSQSSCVTSLFLFQGARLSARADHHGELLLLSDQDRSLWDKDMLASGVDYLRSSARGSDLSDYHLEAEIAAKYALASSFETTDWQQILELYEMLQERHFSVVAELNKIVVLEKLYGPERGLSELMKLESEHGLSSFNLFHIAKAHFLAELGQNEVALSSYELAVNLTTNLPVRRFLTARIEALRSKAAAMKSYSV